MARRAKNRPGDIVYKVEVYSDGLDVGAQKVAAIAAIYNKHLTNKYITTETYTF